MTLISVGAADELGMRRDSGAVLGDRSRNGDLGVGAQQVGAAAVETRSGFGDVGNDGGRVACRDRRDVDAAAVRRGPKAG